METKNNEIASSKMTSFQKNCTIILLLVMSLSGMYDWYIYHVMLCFKLWQILLLIGVIIIIAALVHVYLKTKILNINGELSVVKEEEMDATEEYKKLSKEEEFRQKVTELNNYDAVVWGDILEVLKLNSIQNLGGVNHSIIVSASIDELLEVSEIKKQIKWSPNDLHIALKAIDETLECSFNDSILQTLIDQIKGLEKYSAYAGYGALRSEMRTRYSIMRFVDLKKPDTK